MATAKRAASKRPARKAPVKKEPEEVRADETHSGGVTIISAVGNLIQQAQDEQKKRDH